MELNVSLNVRINTIYDAEHQAFKDLMDIVHKLSAEYVPMSFSVVPVDDKD